MLARATTILVTNTNDNGPGSLRQALAGASDGEYQLRRRSDGVVLPVPFRANDLRPRH